MTKARSAQQQPLSASRVEDVPEVLWNSKLPCIVLLPTLYYTSYDDLIDDYNVFLFLKVLRIVLCVSCSRFQPLGPVTKRGLGVWIALGSVARDANKDRISPARCTRIARILARFQTTSPVDSENTHSIEMSRESVGPLPTAVRRTYLLPPTYAKSERSGWQIPNPNAAVWRRGSVNLQAEEYSVGDRIWRLSRDSLQNSRRSTYVRPRSEDGIGIAGATRRP